MNTTGACLDILAFPSAQPAPEEIVGCSSGPSLAKRVGLSGNSEPAPLVKRFSCLFDNLYCPKRNPNGIVSLGVAENLLCAEEIMAFAKDAIVNNLSAMDLTYGDNLWGSKRLHKALAGFFNRYFDPAERVEPDHMISGVGVSALLDQLFHAILDEQDGVLLLSPYYAGFDRDLVVGRSKVNLIGVECPLSEGSEDRWDGRGGLGEVFEKAYQDAKGRGVNVRAVLITNPHNPLGTTVSRSTLRGYCDFAQKYDLHLVSDEIYAMSVYENKGMPDARPFTSILSIDLEREVRQPFDKARVHAVYGMSKDFCANGFRLGALVSQHNPRIFRTLAPMSMQLKVSSPADVVFSTLLNSDYLSTFLETNRQRLGEAQAFVRSWFEERGVTVRPCHAGHFVWIDMGTRLSILDTAEEMAVFQRSLDGGLYIAPGSAYHCTTPGWFRITFSVAKSNLLEGLARLEALHGLSVIEACA